MKIKVYGSTAEIISRDKLLANTNNAYKIEFQFDNDWLSMTSKVASFYQPSLNRDDPVEVTIEDNSVVIPNSCLVNDDELYIDVSGKFSDGTVWSTNYVYDYVSRSAVTSLVDQQ